MLFRSNPTALKSKLNWSNAIVEYNNELTRLKADSKGKHFVKSEIKQAGRDLTFWETFWFSGRDNGSRIYHFWRIIVIFLCWQIFFISYEFRI